MKEIDSSMLNEAVVCVGSNIAECRAEVSEALRRLTNLMSGSRHTEPYLTVPEGEGAGENPYMNALFHGFTALSAADLAAKFKAYERSRGRKPEDKQAGKIIIDVDLVVFNGEVTDRGEFYSDYFQKGYRLLFPES